MGELRVSLDLAFPLDLVVQKVAVLARSGAGKTNTAVDIVEELLAAEQQVVIVDPPGAWWGLQSSADGKQPGYTVVVFGGLHGNLPLEPASGSIVADLVVDHGISAVCDLSEFTDGEIARWTATFAQRLYARKNAARTPLMLVLEEADELAPQNPASARKDERESSQAMMLHHIERIAKRGRMRGIGFLAISQRSAAFNKHVLSQVEVLIAMQTTAPQDIDAIDDWVKRHGDQERRQQLLAEIAGLPIGTGFVWSPSWLRIFQKVSFRKRRTFDSSATPEPGKPSAAPKKKAEVDLAAFEKLMAGAIERQKADDPRELRKRIAELERQLRERPAGTRTVEVEKRVEVVPVITDEQIAKLGHALAPASAAIGSLEAVIQALRISLRTVSDAVEKMREPHATPTPPARHPDATPPAQQDARGQSRSQDAYLPPSSNGTLGLGERKVLQVLAQFPEGRTSNQLAMLAGYSAKASTLGVILAKLRRLGYVERTGNPRITDSGKSAIGPVDAMPTGPDLFDWWLGHPRIGGGERKVLEVLREHYPDDLSASQLAEITGYSTTASTLGVILAKLRKLGLVEPSARRLTSEFAEAIS